MTAQDLRDALMTRLKDTSIVEANLISVDKKCGQRKICLTNSLD
jgi:hypothetical protein